MMAEKKKEPEPEPEKGEPPQLDPDIVAKGIAMGTFLAGVYFLDKLMGEEKYVKDENDQWILMKKGILDELLE
jgi:hypothetical protein